MRDLSKESQNFENRFHVRVTQTDATSRIFIERKCEPFTWIHPSLLLIQIHHTKANS